MKKRNSFQNDNDGGTWGYGGSFTYICSKIFDVLALGLVWVLCCLPIITIGASSTALYYATVKCVKRSEGYIMQEFFKSFKQNFKPATILWGIFVALTFLMQLNIGILMQKTSGLFGLFFIVFYSAVCIYLTVMMLYAFPALSRFEMGPGWIFKLSLFMTVRYLFHSIMLLAILAMALLFVWKIPMLIFLVPGPMAFLMSEFIEGPLKKHEPQGMNQQKPE